MGLQEIQFGDNDTLSAISSAIVHADYLFLLTDVRCLCVSPLSTSELVIYYVDDRYTDNPRQNPNAQPVRVVRDIQKYGKKVICTSAM